MDTAITQRPVIAMDTVVSSQINAIGHDAGTNTLAIHFKSYSQKPGSVYHYANVTAEQFAEFKAAGSIGAYFGKNIKPFKDRFPYVQVS